VQTYLVLFAVFAMLIAWQVRKVRARRRLREIDAGLRCIACDGVQVDRIEGHVRCNRCGHTASLASLGAAVIRDDEISNITSP
jgi:hypothetical protein